MCWENDGEESNFWSSDEGRREKLVTHEGQQTLKTGIEMGNNK